MDLFQRFTLPKTEKTLQGQVKAAETILSNESLRLQRQLDRLALLKTQVERCTIRAPHDGTLYYFKDPRPDSNAEPVEEGMSVRQRQELFYLPDLSEMQVMISLNESVVDRVTTGLRARVSFEAMPGVVLDGRVVSVSQIPARQGRNGADIRFFVSLVKLNSVVPGLKPGMSSLVDIALPPRKHVVAVPHQALRWDGGSKVCFVADGENLQRREVRTGQDTTDLIEITDGLDEGELVALNPPGVVGGPIPSLLEIDDIEPGEPAHTATVAASHH
jgi:HlyD family secretion protein